jgi:hypothetical protein
MYQFTVANNLTDYFMRNMVPNLRSDPRRQTSQKQTNGQSSSQKDVYMITNPNAVNKYKNIDMTVRDSQNNLNAQPAVQSRPSYGDSVPLSKTGSSESDTRPNKRKVYTYPEGYDVSKQAATGDYGQQTSGNNKISSAQDTFSYGNGNGYPAYSNGIPLGGTSSKNGIPLGGTGNINGVPLGGTVDSNGIPLGGTINKPPLLIANNVPDSKNYFWRISGFTECSRTCGGGKTFHNCVKKIIFIYTHNA